MIDRTESLPDIPEPSDDGWLTVAEAAEATGTTVRNMSREARRAHEEGRPWRGVLMEVRVVKGRGRSAKNYEIKASSLPPGDIVRLPVVKAKPAAAARTKGEMAMDRHDLIRPALQCRPGSRERRIAVDAAARAAGVRVGTVYDWINAYEAEGLAAHVRTERNDKRKKRTYLSRAFDEALRPLVGDAGLAEMEAVMRRHFNSLWASAGTDVGWRHIQRLGSLEAMNLANNAGLADTGTLKRICDLPRDFVRKDWRKFRAVALHDQDRKRHEDRNKGGIRRTRFTRKPMEVVFADVHHLDLYAERQDGSLFTPKLIAFEDWATDRMFVYVALLPKGQSVRMEHVAAALVAMMLDPHWGAPERLYIDNGGEFNVADMIEPLMKLVRQVREIGEEPALAEALRDDRSVIRARPYNARAKSIEGGFKSLEIVLSNLPGHIGGNRMDAKTPNVSRAPVPYPYRNDLLLSHIQTCVAFRNTAKRTSGEMKGLSPADLYEAHVAEGWQPVKVVKPDILAAFGRPDTRIWRDGGFMHDGRFHRAPGLGWIASGTRIGIWKPLFSGFDGIAVTNDDGMPCAVAFPDEPFDVLDVAGAEESGRRAKESREGIRTARAEADELDMLDLLERLVAKEGNATTPEPIGPVRLKDGAEIVGKAMLTTPKQRKADNARRRRDEAERTRHLRASRMNAVEAQKAQDDDGAATGRE
ncbi:MAG: helix-turn-helix domain-containing protein [Boseongicola sp. SB0662_bin_57]|nr:helix-turn-helix domain-containing protein [Boseongicola sp. SB0662_bin_57]